MFVVQCVGVFCRVYVCVVHLVGVGVCVRELMCRADRWVSVA